MYFAQCLAPYIHPFVHKKDPYSIWVFLFNKYLSTNPAQYTHLQSMGSGFIAYKTHYRSVVLVIWILQIIWTAVTFSLVIV